MNRKIETTAMAILVLAGVKMMQSFLKKKKRKGGVRKEHENNI
jgi:putative Mn2+ efflux pump MntP